MAKKMKRDSQDWVPIIVAVAIVLFISSIFIPFVIITIGQDVLFRPTVDFWLFQAPKSSYFAVGAVFAYYGISAGIFSFVQYRIEGKKLLKTLLTSLAIIPGLIVIYLSVNQYYYFTDEGVFRSTFYSTNEEAYYWENMEKVSYVSEYMDNVLTPSYLELRTKDDTILRYDFTNNVLMKYRGRMKRILNEVGVEVEKVELEDKQ